LVDCCKIQGVPEKNAQSLMHHNVATVKESRGFH